MSPAPVAGAASAAPAAGPAVAARPVLRLQVDPGATVRSLEVLAAEARAPRATSSYSMVGLTWRGTDPTLRVRSRGPEGWRPWREAEVLADGAAGEGTPGLRATELLWMDRSDGVQVDVDGSGHRGLRLVLIDPGVRAEDRAAATPSSGTTQRVAPASGRAPQPELISRQRWGADPSWRNGKPRYNAGIRQVVVHHTASGNDYTRADVPGILRGMYRYHTQSLGWFDLGYNFVVDRFGRAWVGRSGGVGRPVRGAHALGFNHASVGISVIGNFEAAKPTNAAVTMVVRLAAWKLDRYGHDARGGVTVRSEGSDRYAAGRQVRLPVISGHRATNETACAGERLQARLPDVRTRAQARIERS
ncbi:N-acetylmuramoyl-L-alanine amidase [Nocardioides sp.]|uniref:peptidoglycan recognition protein family protein n=1 Tax=Nocardioides sp. TaxID=35761 RepID=UPI00286B3025|nr:N-acetylmuramoyl-L-alanine amidase [Nocardioides sp.]